MDITKKFKAKKQVLPTFRTFPVTLEEEVTQGVIDWYTSRGLPVPPEDLAACKGIDAQQEAELKKLQEATEAAPAPLKPAYGTPEFWKDWWAKKRAKEAALKEAGLPVPEPKPKKPRKKTSPKASTGGSG